MSQTPMSGAELDRVLRAFLEAQKPENNGKLLYIHDGRRAFHRDQIGAGGVSNGSDLL